jgi:Na+/H+-dicarboxylate symporter
MAVQLPSKPDKTIRMDVIDDDEQFIGLVRKHIFGLIVIYIQAALGLFVALGLIYFLVASVGSEQNLSNIYNYVTMFAIAAIALTAVILIAVTYVFHQNKLIITDKNLTQTLQFGLFTHKTSQLTLANVEDVTAEQHGIFAAIFGYGTLKFETAGEQANFYFTYCPNPSYYAKQILEARERYVIEP